MEKTMKNTTTEEVNENKVESAEDAIKKAAEEQFAKIRLQGLLIGAQSTSRMILDKIATFKRKQGKPTMNDYKRLIKDIESFCAVSLSREINTDGEITPVEESSEAETVQN